MPVWSTPCFTRYAVSGKRLGSDMVYAGDTVWKMRDLKGWDGRTGILMGRGILRRRG